MKSKYFFFLLFYFILFFSGMSQRSGWRAVLQGDLRPILPARRYISLTWRQIWIGIGIIPLEILSIFIDPPGSGRMFFSSFFAQVTQHNSRHDWQKISLFHSSFQIYFWFIFSKKSLFTKIIVICLYIYECASHKFRVTQSANPAHSSVS